jgi:hypothetical protein
MRRTRIYSERTGSAKRRGKSRNLCRRGETTIKERRYDEDYATFFKGSPEYKGMLLMISPKDGRVEAAVEICRKKKSRGYPRRLSSIRTLRA